MAGLEARLVISAQDDTAKAFNSIKERIAGIEKIVGPLNKAMAAVGPAAKSVEAFKIPAGVDAELSKMVSTIGRVDKTMRDVGRSAGAVAGNIGKTSAEVVQLSGRLMDAGSKMKAIGDFKLSTRGVKEASLAMQRAEQEARSLAAKLDGVANPARSMVAAHAGALVEVREVGKALERQVATASAARTALAELGVPLNALRTEEERLKSVIDGTNASLVRQISIEREGAAAAQKAAAASRMSADEVARHPGPGGAHGDGHGFANFALQSAAMAVSAHAIVHGIESTLEHGAEYQHRLVALQNTGRTPEEIAEMNTASHQALRGVPTTTLTDNLEILTETVGAFGSVEHAIEHLGFMARSSAILHAVAGDKIGESAGAMGNSMAKFFEMRGTAGNSAVFEHEASEMMKGMIFSGGNVNPRELLNFAKMAKSSLQNYSLDFLSRVAPSLIGEVGGDRAGTQANAFNSVILGKANDAKQAAAWQKYKLIDPKMMTGKGDKMTGWTGGAIYHTDEFLADPFKAGVERLLPALKAGGVNIDSQLELTKVLGTLFRNINAAAFANELWQKNNQSRIVKDRGYIDKVEDPEAIYRRLLRTDPTVALGALKGSLGSFLTTLSSPLMGTASVMMSGLAETLNNLAIVAHDNPATAVTAGIATAVGALGVAGKLSYGLLNGFGNATFGPAAGEMVAAGHEQLAAGRMMLGAAEAMRVGAIGQDLPGMMPGGKMGAVVREGEALAKGALTVEALEIAATAGVTLTAGSVAFLGLSAAAIIAGLRATTPPKHRASDDPGFGNPFAAGKGIDFSDPNLQGKMDDAKKNPLDRVEGAHPRGSLAPYKDTDHRGHWVAGSHGTSHYVLESVPDLKNAPYFSTAPLDEHGHVNGMLHGWMGDRVPVDPSTGSIFGLNRMPTNPNLYAPADVPVPPVRPGSNIERRTFGAYLDFARPQAAAGSMPMPTRGGPIPVQIVGGAPALHDGWLDGERPQIEERARRGAAMFRQDHEGTVGRHMMEHFSSLPDLSNIHAIVEGPVTATVTGQASINVLVTVNPSGQLLSAVAKAESATVALKSGGTSGAVGTSYPQTAPTGRMGGPR